MRDVPGNFDLRAPNWRSLTTARIWLKIILKRKFEDAELQEELRLGKNFWTRINSGK